MSELYVRSDTGEVVSEEQRAAVMALVKILFRLDIINDIQAVKIASRFHILFV